MYGGPITVDLSRLAAGEMLVLEWRRQPLYVVRRTAAMIAGLEQSEVELVDSASLDSEQPDYAANYHRSKDPEYLVLQGVCTHLGCAPKHVDAATKQALPNGGFHCSCHNSHFDLAGRALKGFPAGKNLLVPPHHFVTPHTLVVGTHA